MGTTEENEHAGIGGNTATRTKKTDSTLPPGTTVTTPPLPKPLPAEGKAGDAAPPSGVPPSASLRARPPPAPGSGEGRGVNGPMNGGSSRTRGKGTGGSLRARAPPPPAAAGPIRARGAAAGRAGPGPGCCRRRGSGPVSPARLQSPGHNRPAPAVGEPYLRQGLRRTPGTRSRPQRVGAQRGPAPLRPSALPGARLCAGTAAPLRPPSAGPPATELARRRAAREGGQPEECPAGHGVERSHQHPCPWLRAAPGGERARWPLVGGGVKRRR